VKDIAERMNIPDFKAPVGWLDNLKKRYNIHGRTISDEADSVSNARRTPRYHENLALKDIYSVGETALFYNLFPNRSRALKGSNREVTMNREMSKP